MERAEHLNVKPCGLFQYGLYLHAVFADDICIVAAGLVKPVPVKVDLVIENIAVQGFECSESVRAEEDLIRLVVGHHDFRPVHHGRHHKMQGVFSGAECVAFFYNDLFLFQVKAEELVDHREGFGVADDLHFRVAQRQFIDHGAVVRLHVVDDQVVKRSAVQDSLYIFQELASYGVICGIKKNGFLVHQQIGVVGHSVRERENIFEQFDPAVACAHPVQIFCDFSVAVHIKSSLYLRHNE